MHMVPREIDAKSWFYRLLMGPAKILDGLVWVLTFGFVSLGLDMWAARQLARKRNLARMKASLKAKNAKQKQQPRTTLHRL